MSPIKSKSTRRRLATKVIMSMAAGAVLMFGASASWAGKPGSGGVFATSCDAISYGYPREAIAINAPTGTTMITFSFWRQRSVYDASMADPLYIPPPGYAQSGTDFDKRDGWWMFSTEASEVVVAEARNRKGVILATAMDYCILAQ